MKKQILEIEVPDGKKIIWKDGRIIFDDEDTMESIKSIEDAVQFIINKKICKDILDSLFRLPRNSYEWKIAAYRAVVAAVTYNEQRHLTTGERWIPTIEFCRPGRLMNCCGDIIVGRIQSEGKEFDVISGSIFRGSSLGLGCYDLGDNVSNAGALSGFRSVNSKKAALHISKWFGRLLFEVIYGGTNCDWIWID